LKIDKNLILGIAIGAGLAITVPVILKDVGTKAHLAEHEHHHDRHRHHHAQKYGAYGDTHRPGFPIPGQYDE
jgi:hypothetical protein